VDIRPQPAQNRSHGVGAEKKHGINAANCGNEKGAVAIFDNRSTRATKVAGGAIVVDRHDEEVTHSCCRLKVAKMADMQQVEQAVCHHDPYSGTAVAQGTDAPRDRGQRFNA
jgi:hypothetical protein